MCEQLVRRRTTNIYIYIYSCTHIKTHAYPKSSFNKTITSHSLYIYFFLELLTYGLGPTTSHNTQVQGVQWKQNQIFSPQWSTPEPTHTKEVLYNGLHDYLCIKHIWGLFLLTTHSNQYKTERASHVDILSTQSLHKVRTRSRQYHTCNHSNPRIPTCIKRVDW
jgi:hypothetical protein